MRDQQHQPCDTRPAVTMEAPGSRSDQQFHVTEMEAIAASRHTSTCVCSQAERSQLST